jgi:type I restriction enzyme S subunit
MKNGWEIRRLPEIAEYSIGLTYSPKDVSDKGLVVLRSSNIQNDQLDLSDLVRVTRPVKDTLKVRGGDILMCSRNGSKRLVGKTTLIGKLPEEMTFGTFMTVIRGKSNPYLAWFFKSDAFREQIGVGENTMINQVTKYMLDAIRVPLPPLSEQKRIVGILDESFDGIATAAANSEKNLKNARAIFESYLESVFTQRGVGWVESTIGDAIRFIDYRGKTPIKTAGGVRLITAKNVKMGYLQEAPKEFIAPASYQGWMTRGIPQKGDVLFTTEAPLANVAQLDTDEKVAFAQRIIVMQTDKTKLDSTFLKYLLLSGPIQQRIRADGTGATVQGIKASLLRLIEISFPKTLAEQERIVEILDALREETERLAVIYEQKLEALDALKKSLLHRAFTAQL